MNKNTSSNEHDGNIEIRAPSEQTEGTRSQVQRWLKSVGDAVVENEPLIELETDKVTIEIPAPAGGVLAEILKQEQDEIAPGELLGRIQAGGESAHGRQGRAPVQASYARARDRRCNDCGVVRACCCAIRRSQ